MCEIGVLPIVLSQRIEVGRMKRRVRLVVVCGVVDKQIEDLSDWELVCRCCRLSI